MFPQHFVHKCEYMHADCTFIQKKTKKESLLKDWFVYSLKLLIVAFYKQVLQCKES